MKKYKSSYEPHLTLREIFVPPSSEWTPRFSGWSLVQVREGAGYYLQSSSNLELETGAVLVLAESATGIVRASQLGGMTLCGFNVIPSRLTGLMALSEQRLLEAAATNRESTVQSLAPEHRVAVKMAGMIAEPRRADLLFRLKLLELMVDLFIVRMKQSMPVIDSQDARKRLQDFLERTPSSELIEIDFEELAQMTHCTSRHLSRIFHELVGVSFREMRAELRLTRARELLATTNHKVIDVALESGYKSLSLFNLVFARRFGISPARWRKQQEKPANPANAEKAAKRLPAASTIQQKISWSRQFAS